MKADSATPYLFFTGKGGVGKTSLACAIAIEFADEGKRVLLISTDPASNLQDVLESPVNEKINPIKGVANLSAININPEVSAEEYRNRVTGPLKDFLSEAEIKKINEELSGACTTEIASFDEFSRFISGEGGGEILISLFSTRHQRVTRCDSWNYPQPGRVSRRKIQMALLVWGQHQPLKAVRNVTIKL